MNAQENHSAEKKENRTASVNKRSVDAFKQQKRKEKLPEEYFRQLVTGDMVALGQAITLVESVLPRHMEVAAKLLELCSPFAGRALRIGITGVPGVGKSSFIETFGLHLIAQGKKVAVLAVDPSSVKSGGSILGDKTRMEKLAASTSAFIRPSPSGKSLGGVARKTREAIVLCETAGFDIIIIETVGVGQSEVAVHSMVDFFLLLMLAGAGDEMQGIKRGIIEMADTIIITKADGANIDPANRAVKEYSAALHLYPLPPSGWIPRVLTCSAHENKGITTIWEMITEYMDFVSNNEYLDRLRREQALYWFREALQEGLENHFFSNETIKMKIEDFETAVENQKIEPYVAAQKLLKEYFENRL